MYGKKAETGIGTLIIFIAMILVAAIAAGVLIQTATSLQNKALLTGERTKGQVSTGMSTLLLYATNGSDGSVEDFRQKMKLAPGSDPITMSDVLIEFDTETVNGDYIYSADNCTRDMASDGTGDGYFYNSTHHNGTFTVRYLVRGPNSQDGYLVRGDIIMLCYSAPGVTTDGSAITSSGIGEDTNVLINFVPKRGTPMVIETATPNIMTSERVYIFP
jgi:flagellin-like protein